LEQQSQYSFLGGVMTYEEEQHVPCKLCDAPDGRKGTNLCDGCWEVEHRLGYFLKNKKARDLILEKLKEYYPLYEFKVPDVGLEKALRATGRDEEADKLESCCPRREFNINGTMTSQFSVSSKSAKPRTEIEAKRDRFKKAYGKDMVLDAAREVKIKMKPGKFISIPLPSHSQPNANGDEHAGHRPCD